MKDKLEARRLLAEEEIRESERKYRELFETVKDGIAATDMEGYFLECNQAFLDMLGYSAAEIRKKRYQDITPKKWHKMEAEIQAKQVRVRGYSDEYEKEYIKKDGTIIPVSIRVWLRKDREGKPIGDWAIVRDITEKKRVEKALRESEEKFRLAFENAKDAILWADPKTGLIINCNKAAEALLEKKREEIVGRYQTTIHPPQKAKYYARMFKRHIKQKGAVDDEAEVITKSGKIKPVHITASVTLVGEKPIIQGVFRDITERKKMEEALRENEERFRTIFENANDVILYVDKYGKILNVNKKVKEIFGYERDEVIGKNFAELGVLGVKELPKIIKLFRNAVRSGRFAEMMELEVRNKKGDRICVEVSSRSIKKNGKLEGFLSILRDVTERKQAEKVLKESEERYRRLLEYSGNAMIVIEEDKTISFVNRQFEKLSGYSKKEIIGKTFLDLIPEKEKQRMARYHEQRRKPGGRAPITYQFESVDKKGKTRIVEATVAMIPGTGKSTVALKDITKYKELEEKLRQTMKELRKLKAKLKVGKFKTT